jgi:O-antigen polysaccharide polymerase Wzy
MSSQFLAYGGIACGAWLAVLLLVGVRNAFDLGRCVGWYLLVFLATYMLRPAMSELSGNYQMYDLLKLGSFEAHWHLMAIAAPLAILSFGIAYRASGPSARKSRPKREPSVDPRKVRLLIYCMIIVGYLCALISAKTGTLAGEGSNVAGVGVYEHNTAWFAQADLFVSSGTVLYYILTGELKMSLLLAGPWIIFRIIMGWGRSHLLGHFFALMAIYFIRQRQTGAAKVTSSQIAAIGGAVVVILMLFPLLSDWRGLKNQLHLNVTSVSKDTLMMVGAGTDPQDLLQTYMGTNSAITGFEQSLSHIVNDPRPEFGTQYLYFYLFKPIPRILWPGKGTPYSWPKRLLGIEDDPLLTSIGAAPGAIGMAYEQWGWIGIIFEFMLTGFVIRKAEEAALLRPGALHVQLGYAGLYSMVPQLGRDSLLYMISSFWLFKFGIPVLILWRMARTAAVRARFFHKRAMAAARGMQATT